MLRNSTRVRVALSWLLSICSMACGTHPLAAQQPLPTPGASDTTSVNYRVTRASQRLDMVVNSSRLITLDKPIPRMQVHNQKILRAMPVGPSEIQVSAQAPGVTQLNLWDGEDPPNLYTVDVVITGDARELEGILASQFPSAAIKVTVLPTGAIISGTVTDGTEIDRVMAVTEQYYPHIVNNIRVVGVQSVLLHTKVLEVSRTKLRAAGIDLGYLSGGNFVAVTGSGNLLSPRTSAIGTIANASTEGTARIGGVFGTNTVDSSFVSYANMNW